MSQPDSNKYTQPEPMTPPSRADLLLMSKLFSLGADGAWVREVNAPTSEPARRAIRNWVCKGYAHYTQDPDLFILNDSCARMCGEALAAAFDERIERSMLDQKPKSRKNTSSQRVAAAILAGLLAAMLMLAMFLVKVALW